MIARELEKSRFFLCSGETIGSRGLDQQRRTLVARLNTLMSAPPERDLAPAPEPQQPPNVVSAVLAQQPGQDGARLGVQPHRAPRSA